MTAQPLFRFVVPCFNEEDNVEPTVNSICAAVGERTHYEIILVNDCSRDQTLERMQALTITDRRITIIDNPVNLGLGGSYKRGAAAAEAKIRRFRAMTVSQPEHRRNPRSQRRGGHHYSGRDQPSSANAVSCARVQELYGPAQLDILALLATVERVYRALIITVEDFAIIIFDDGSSDGTHAVAESASQRFPFVTVRRNERRKGAGSCTVEASRDAKSAYLVYVPADNTWPLRSFIELFGHLAKADVVTSYSNNLMAAMPAPKRLVSRSYSLILNVLFLRGIRYYNGLTIYPVEYLRQGSVRAHGFGFQAEALLKAVIAGYSFLEIALPVDAQNLPRARSITLPNIIDALLTICSPFSSSSTSCAAGRHFDCTPCRWHP